MIDGYDWAGGREAMLRLGPADGPVVIVALPPFEEANRIRTFAVTMLRALADRGIGSLLPDLPGTGESLVATEDSTLAGWRGAFARAAAVGGARHGIVLRGGALIDTDAALDSRWHLSPQAGAALVRELDRIRQAAGGEDSDETIVEIAGNRLSRHLLGEIGAADVSDAPTRVVRLANDARPADRAIDSPPLWRRAEPGNDPQLAAMLADDIATWVRQCER